MPGMDGLELLVIGRRGHQPLQYLDGAFVDADGEPIADLQDLTCYQCMSRYYTHRDDPVQFCPGCGGWERPAFETLDALLEWAGEQSFAFLLHSVQGAFAVRVESGWWLRMAPHGSLIERDPAVHDVVALRTPAGRT